MSKQDSPHFMKFSNEIEKAIITGELELPAEEHIKRLDYSLPKKVKDTISSMNEFYCNFICPSIKTTGGEDYLYDHLEKIVEFDEIKIDKLPNDELKIRYAVYKGVMYYLNNLNSPPGSINKHFNSVLLKNIDFNANKDELLKALKNMDELIDTLSGMIYKSYGIMVSEPIYFSYGKRPRKTYRSLIDLISISDEGLDCFFITPKVLSNHSSTMMMSNPKILAAIKHFSELNINVRSFYEIAIPFLDKNKFVINKVGMNKFTSYYAKKFFDFDYIDMNDPIKCRSCVYQNKCSLKDMFPIITV